MEALRTTQPSSREFQRVSNIRLRQKVKKKVENICYVEKNITAALKLCEKFIKMKVYITMR